jgi:uncharacterized protein (UPF0147 family)
MKPFTFRIPDSTREGIEIAAEMLGQESSIVVRTAVYSLLDDIAEHQHDPSFYREMAAKIQAARGRDAA